MLTHIVRYIFRTARPTNFRLGIRMEDDDPHQPQAPWPPMSKINVARSRDQSEQSWPNAVPVSLEAGGGIPYRPNPAATLLVWRAGQAHKQIWECVHGRNGSLRTMTPWGTRVNYPSQGVRRKCPLKVMTFYWYSHKMLRLYSTFKLKSGTKINAARQEKELTSPRLFGRYFPPVCLSHYCNSHTPVASLLITGVVFLRFWVFSGFENWSSQWLSRGNLDF